VLNFLADIDFDGLVENEKLALRHHSAMQNSWQGDSSN